MKKLYALLTAIMLFTTAQAQDSYGSDFWIAVPGNYSVLSPELYITAQSASSVTVSMPGLAFTTTVAIAANTLQTIVLPATAQIQTSGISNLGIHITSTTDVTVYLMNAQSATTDAYMALPVDALGTDYYVMGYDPDAAFSIPAQLTIVATQNNTTVNINPKAPNSAALPVGVNTAVVLQQGETYQIRSTVYSAAGDFTGSKVTSDKPIAVFGGNQCTNISGSLRACDHLVEQMPPTTAWGTSFVTVPLATRTAGDVFRIMAQTNSTSVSINGSVVATLAAGAFYETILASGTFNRIVASNPILVGQYSRSSDADGVTSDPFFALVPPDDQFLVNYIISSGTANIPINYINITSPTSNTANVMVDGLPVAGWTAIPGTSFSGKTVGVANGVHSVTSVLPIGVLAYGYGSYDSYGYLGGQSFSPVATVSQMSLNLTQTTSIQAQQKCIVATVLDQNNVAVPNVLVNFNVFGASTAAGFGNTNASGQVTLCYNTCIAGIDTFVASIAGILDTVYVTVAPSTMTVLPASINATAGVQSCVTATIKDGSNIPVPNAFVNFTVTGANSAATVVLQTNASGQAQFCYTPTNTGNDQISVISGCAIGASTTVNVVVGAGGGACNFTNTISAAKPIMLYQNAGANLANTYYSGLSFTMYITANPTGGVGPFTYAWTSKSGYTIKTPTSKTAGLYYPTGAGWVKVAITDVGANCTSSDSIYINFVDYTCPPQPGMLWYYQVCNTQTQTPVCVKRTAALNTLLTTNPGIYMFGTCSPKTNAVANNSGFTVYPNPTAGYITIEQTFDVTSKGTIDVLDISGRVLYTESVDLNAGAFNYTVNLSKLPNGLYLVRLSSDREFYTERVQLIK